MEINFNIFSTRNESDIYFHRIYQVVFLDRDTEEIDIWTALAVTVKGPKSDRLRAILEVIPRDRNKASRTLARPALEPLPLGGDPLDAWKALTEVWGEDSTWFHDPGTVYDAATVNAHINGERSAFTTPSIPTQRYLEVAEANVDGDQFATKLASELKKARNSNQLLGRIWRNADGVYLPLSIGEFEPAPEGGEGVILKPPAGINTAHIPAFWLLRNRCTPPDGGFFRALGARQFTYRISVGQKDPAVPPPRIGEFRLYIVAPHLFTLRQSADLTAEQIYFSPRSGEADPDLNVEPISTRYVEPLGATNSLDRQSLNYKAYLHAWREEKEIDTRAYYRVRLPSAFSDYSTPFNSVEMPLQIVSEYGNLILFSLGLMIPVLLSFGLDDTRILEFSHNHWWDLYVVGVLPAFQWAVLVIVSSLTLVLPIFEPLDPRRSGMFVKITRWMALGFFSAWCLCAFVLSDPVRVAWQNLACSNQLCFLPFSLLPVGFGVVAILAGLACLVAFVGARPRLFSSIRASWPHFRDS